MKTSFDALLEAYIFGVATHVVASSSHHDQQKLVAKLRELDAPTLTADNCLTEIERLAAGRKRKAIKSSTKPSVWNRNRSAK